VLGMSVAAGNVGAVVESAPAVGSFVAAAVLPAPTVKVGVAELFEAQLVRARAINPPSATDRNRVI
jgi:hypothetical protein